MATAILSGLKSSKYQNCVINVFDIDSQKMHNISGPKVRYCKTIKDLTINSNFIFLAIKPQDIESVLLSINRYITQEKTIVSIAAGISINYIAKRLNRSCNIIRAMPNAPMLVCSGITGICCSDNTEKDVFDTVIDMFRSCSLVEVLPENMMNTVTAISGSGPAYVFLFAKAMIDYATNNRILDNTARNLVCQTLIGSAKLIHESNTDLDKLINSVCSPGGTTAEAMRVFEDRNFYDTIIGAMSACDSRAQELQK